MKMDAVKINDDYPMAALDHDISTVKKELDKIVRQADEDTSEYVPKQKAIADAKRIQAMLNNQANKLTKMGKDWVSSTMK